MTHDKDALNNGARRGQPVSDGDLRELGEAIAHLAGDSTFIIRSLTDTIRAMRPVSTGQRLTDQQKLFLIESGTFTADELAATSREVDKGSLQLGAADAWLSQLCATLSLKDAAGFLGWGEAAVRAAISEGRLYAVEISGQYRFPVWQFDLQSPDKLIPGLATVVEIVAPRWSWLSVGGFMATRQESLVAEGRKTPVAWLRDGGDVDAVRQIVESDDWW